MALAYDDVMTWLFDRNGFQKLTADEHREFIGRVNEATRMKKSSAVNKFNIGDEVQFSTKSTTVNGKITKINRLTVGVRDTVSGMEWKVSPSVLQKK